MTVSPEPPTIGFVPQDAPKQAPKIDPALPLKTQFEIFDGYIKRKLVEIANVPVARFHDYADPWVAKIMAELPPALQGKVIFTLRCWNDLSAQEQQAGKASYFNEVARATRRHRGKGPLRLPPIPQSRILIDFVFSDAHNTSRPQDNMGEGNNHDNRTTNTDTSSTSDRQPPSAQQ